MFQRAHTLYKREKNCFLSSETENALKSKAFFVSGFSDGYSSKIEAFFLKTNFTYATMLPDSGVMNHLSGFKTMLV